MGQTLYTPKSGSLAPKRGRGVSKKPPPETPVSGGILSRLAETKTRAGRSKFSLELDVGEDPGFDLDVASLLTSVRHHLLRHHFTYIMANRPPDGGPARQPSKRVLANIKKYGAAAFRPRGVRTGYFVENISGTKIRGNETVAEFDFRAPGKGRAIFLNIEAKAGRPPYLTLQGHAKNTIDLALQQWAAEVFGGKIPAPSSAETIAATEARRKASKRAIAFERREERRKQKEYVTKGPKPRPKREPREPRQRRR